MNAPSPPSRAFTLLELLVAIGVVAVLIGVLLPVLSGARRSALSASCLSNLRSLGQAIEMYRGANHDLLPYAAAPVPPFDDEPTIRAAAM